MSLNYVSLPSETQDPYKQVYHYTAIRVRDGGEMTDERTGLWREGEEGSV